MCQAFSNCGFLNGKVVVIIMDLRLPVGQNKDTEFVLMALEKLS